MSIGSVVAVAVFRMLAHVHTTTCQTTVWDPHWDPRLRSIIHGSLLERQADVYITAAFESAECTTLAAAKGLTDESSCLQGFTAIQRETLLHEVRDSDAEGVLQNNHSMTTTARHTAAALRIV
jgi:hypothetical protein